MGKRGARSTAIKPAAGPASNTAIQTIPGVVPLVARPPITKPSGGPALVAYNILSAIASLRLTVALFALSLLLILFGTLAQMDQGIHTVLHTYFRCFLAWIPWQLFVRFGQVFFSVSPDLQVAGGFPFPGGWTLGILLLINVLAAHAVRFKLSWKRSGVLVLHSGLIILLLGEFIAGVFQQEGRMEIWEGASSNYTQDYHKVELALIDPSDPKEDKVIAIPVSFLRPGETIQHEALPFDVSVVDYYANASGPVRKAAAPPDTPDPATAGDGRDLVVVKQAPVPGTGSEIDTPAAYVKLLPKGSNDASPLGTYLVTVHLPDTDQSVKVGDKSYRLSLRFARTYRPYRLHLIKFSFDRYPGTGIPKNYSSLVHLEDPERNENREVLIRMNEPLWYRSETFYQSDFDHKTEKATVLQVVRNPGWAMPYISCFLVVVGMLVHFGIHLIDFLRRRLAL
jgi:hypothetical protein